MISLPLNITPKGLKQEDNMKRALDQSIQLLLTTPQFSTPADLNFGFVFNNLRFELLNEYEGVVYDPKNQEEPHGLEGLYDKKISGSSRNLNTFAADLRDTLRNYEKRLRDVAVTMTYIREERMIYVTIKGVIVETQQKYEYTTTMKVWK